MHATSVLQQLRKCNDAPPGRHRRANLRLSPALPYFKHEEPRRTDSS